MWSQVETASIALGPGDVYVGSPACCYHSVAYNAEAEAASDGDAPQSPSTIVVHLRSNFFKRRATPQWFHLSNRLLSEALAPVVAHGLAEDPLELPCLAEVRAAEQILGAVPAAPDPGTPAAKRRRTEGGGDGPSPGPSPKSQRGAGGGGRGRGRRAC